MDSTFAGHTEKPTTLKDLENEPMLLKRLEFLERNLAERFQETVFWIGAGLSAKVAGMPTWKAFLLSLADLKIGRLRDRRNEILVKRLISTGRLSHAAEYLHEELGEGMIRRLVSSFNKKSRILPEFISKYCVNEIVTTNYDTLIEQAMPWYRVVTPAQEIDELLSPGFKLIKIHGCVTKPTSCVFKISNYARAYNANLRWYLADLFSTKTVVFVGSSMNSAEPFFNVLEMIRNTGRRMREHIAIVSVRSSRDGALKGKEFQKQGIKLLPYVPDTSHSILNDIFKRCDKSFSKTILRNHEIVDPKTQIVKTEVVNTDGFLERIRQCSAHLDRIESDLATRSGYLNLSRKDAHYEINLNNEKRLVQQAAVYLWNLVNNYHNLTSNHLRLLSDLVPNFFRLVDNLDKDWSKFIERTGYLGYRESINDFLVNSGTPLDVIWCRSIHIIFKMRKSIGGMRKSLNILERITGTEYQILWKVLEYYEGQTTKFKSKENG